MLTYIDTGSSITVVLDCTPRIVPSSHHKFSEIRQALADPSTTEDDVKKLINLAEGITEFSSGRIRVEHGILYYNDTEIDGAIRPKILDFLRANRPDLADPLCKFLDRVYDNPSYRAVNGLFEWVSKSGMPITPEGKILAWKIVRGDYFDYHSRTLDHSPGRIVELPRNHCDEDPDQTCSRGIHFCSYDYLPHYASGDSDRRIMLVEIDPADVVAIPRDYNTAKGRCCRLRVVGEVPEDEVRKIFPDTRVAPAAPRLEVGQTWITDEGDRVKLVDQLDDGNFEGCADSGRYYIFEPDGREVDDECSLDRLA